MWAKGMSDISLFATLVSSQLTIATEKRGNHEPKSLETMVENLVKNWEVEASHKLDVNEWRTVDPDNYTFSVNGGAPQDAKHMLKV